MIALDAAATLIAIVSAKSTISAPIGGKPQASPNALPGGCGVAAALREARDEEPVVER